MPHTPPLLEDLLLLLLASVPVVFLFNRLRLPTIVGFIIAGVMIGPYGLNLISETKEIEALAEIGVALLLFTIGLEFSLRRIFEMRRIALVGGGLQVGLTVAVVALIAHLFGRGVNQAIFFGFLFALSSTAIVLKTYAERAETDTPHGRAGVGVLLFQDISIVPMMLLVPALGGRGDSSVAGILATLGVAVVAVAFVVLASRLVVPRLLGAVAGMRSSEVFVVTAVILSLGTAWLTSLFGLSLALGAFIAGMVLSESEYSHQIVADILPFRDVFNSIFFVSIGMLLSLSALIGDWLVVLAWVGALLLGKTLLVFAAVRLSGLPTRVAVMTGLGLAQVGEFSFILAKAGFPHGLLAEADYQRFLAASVISMIAAPFLIRLAPRAGYAAQSLLSPAPERLPPPAEDAGGTGELGDHVLIVGYGINGRNLARVLRRVGVPYRVLDLNANTVRGAKAGGEEIVFGDATRREVLRAVGVERAGVLVLAISDPEATRRAVVLARRMNPRLHIIVRTRYLSEVPELERLGADEIVPEEFETGIAIFARVLRERGIAPEIVARHAEEIRSLGYQMLRASLASEDEITARVARQYKTAEEAAREPGRAK